MEGFAVSCMTWYLLQEVFRASQERSKEGEVEPLPMSPVLQSRTGRAALAEDELLSCEYLDKTTGDCWDAVGEGLMQ